ncbi:SNF1-related protein kinase regulatory subunit gamma-1-like [Rutidosis leptorrhynchoides]|uniref:SNF1-related protein kinase regulatory subunit gamma-1-like n=1 Tax=Rutidosis leptorrhynchoides TaxID=125765 RepID=UPI003A996DEC
MSLESQEIEMDFRKVEEIVKDSKGGGILEKKDAILSTLNSNTNTKSNSDNDSDSDSGVPNPTTSPPVDSASALQLFLDHIPISSIPGIHNSPSTVVVVRTQELVKDGIKILYEKNASGALIADSLDEPPDPTNAAMFTTSFSHPYVGFISFSNMVLWSLQEYKKHQSGTKMDDANNSKMKYKNKKNGLFAFLDNIPVVSEAKIGELAASFLWNPVFPVKLDQTIFHVLLLLSKHRLSVVPVTEHASSKVVGYITENAINHVLLQSSGLEWFDSIADKPSSDFRFENTDRIFSVYNDQSIAEAIHILWMNKVCAIAVVHRQTQKLIGCVRVSDVHHLLDDDHIFTDREDLSVEQFIHKDTVRDHHDLNHEVGALIDAGTLALHNNFEPRMDSVVTNTERDSLKQVMKNLEEKKSNFSFVVDECERVKGMVTLRDILMEFSPPCMDSRIDGGGFFDMALKESGCTIKDGTMVHIN